MQYLTYRVVDMRYHTSGDYQVLFSTNDCFEAMTTAKESGGSATLIKVNEDEFETVIFIKR